MTFPFFFKNKLLGHNHHQNLKIFVLGLPSGFLASFLLSTFSFWAKDSGLDLTVLGLFTWISIPYGFKFFMSPITSYIQWGFLGKKFGPQRLWMFFCLLMSFFLLIVLSNISFFRFPWLCSLLAFFLCILATLWDSMIEPYRVFLNFSKKKQETKKNNILSSAFEVFGYRFGFWFGSSFPLMVAHYYSWGLSLKIMAFFLFIFLMVFVFFSKDSQDLFPKMNSSPKNYRKDLWNGVVFFIRQESTFPLLKFLILFKISDIFCRSMISHCLRDNGYSKMDLAFFEKTFGMVALILAVVFSKKLIKSLGFGPSWPIWSSIHGLKSVFFFLGLFTTGVSKILFDGAGLLMIHGLGPWGRILFLNLTSIASKNKDPKGIVQDLGDFFSKKNPEDHGENKPQEEQNNTQKYQKFYHNPQDNHGKDPSMDNPQSPKETNKDSPESQGLTSYDSQVSFEILTIRLAFLHSFVSLLRFVISPIAGFIAQKSSWGIFFLTDILLSLGGCMFFHWALKYLDKCHREKESKNP